MSSPGQSRVSVSAIVLAFGKEPLLRECVRSLRAALVEIDGESELVVVLNAISPEGRRALAESDPPPVLVDPGRNVGFAAGVGLGVARSRGEWIALVNDDCVVDVAAVRELLAAGAGKPEVGSVAARVLFADRGVVNSAGIEVDELGIASERLLGQPAEADSSGGAAVFGASGGAALYRRRMLEETGGFDDSFFAYLEDADLAWRARMQGWQCVYAPTAVVHHRHSTSLGHGSADKHYLVGRNRVRMLAKNATLRQLVRHGPAMLAYDVAYVVHAGVTGRTLAPLRGRLRGLREWPAYRRAGRVGRRAVPLARSAGVRGALSRNRTYGASTSS